MGKSAEVFLEEMEAQQTAKEVNLERVQEYLQALTSAVEDGHHNGLSAFAIVDKIEKGAKAAKEIIFKTAIIEAESHSAKTFEEHGQKFERKEGSRKYDFSNVPEHVEAKSTLAEIVEKYKAVHQQWEKGVNSVDENGEVLPVPVVTFNKSSISVKK